MYGVGCGMCREGVGVGGVGEVNDSSGSREHCLCACIVYVLRQRQYRCMQCIYIGNDVVPELGQALGHREEETEETDYYYIQCIESIYNELIRV